MKKNNSFVFLTLLFLCIVSSSCGKKEVEEIKVKHPSGEKHREQTSEPSSSDTSGQIKIVEKTGKDSTKLSGEKETSGSTIKPSSADNYIGQNVTVKGYVADVHITKKVAYLNFDNKYPRNTFTGVIFARSFAIFDDIEKYNGKTVEISGEVTQYNGKPQIILESKDQIRIAN